MLLRVNSQISNASKVQEEDILLKTALDVGTEILFN